MIALICGKTTEGSAADALAPSTVAASSDLGVERRQRRHDQDHRERYLRPDIGDDDREEGEVGVVQPGDRAVDQAISRRSPLMIPQLGWKTQIHRTALIAPGSTQGRSTIERRKLHAEEIAVQEERRRGAEHDDRRRREEREEERVLQRDAEILAGDDGPVVVESDPVLAGEEEHHLVQAGPQRMGDREDRQERGRKQHRQEPERRGSVGWSTCGTRCLAG